MKILELPFASATILDSSQGSGSAALQKYRHTLCRNFDPGIKFSLGNAGTIRLNTIASMDCVATAKHWKPSQAQRLEKAYTNAGMDEVIKSAKYTEALSAAREAVRSTLKEVGRPASQGFTSLISQSIADLTSSNSAVREIAVTLGGIIERVDAEVAQMKRLPGRIVRNEGPDTLIVVNSGERSVLRTENTEYLASMGLQERGTPFMLHEFRWTPGAVVSVYFPAVDLEAVEDPELEAELKAAEEPLDIPAEAPELATHIKAEA